MDAESETLIPTIGAVFDVAHTLRGEGFDASEDGTGRGTPIIPIVMPTMRAGAANGGKGHGARSGDSKDEYIVPVAFAQNSRDELREMPYVGALSAEPGMKQTSYIRTAMQVRRLTPEECEALQSFPRNYTRIPWRNKPANQCPDGPRYKTLGNSWCVYNVRWIGERIQQVNQLESA